MSLPYQHDKPKNYLRNSKNVESGHTKLYGSRIVTDCKFNDPSASSEGDINVGKLLELLPH